MKLILAMNLTTSVALLALMAANNQLSYHQADALQRNEQIRCFSCGIRINETSDWCYTPTEKNAPDEKKVACQYACVHAVYTHISEGVTVLERQCATKEECKRLENDTTIELKNCCTCFGDLCNDNVIYTDTNGGTKPGSSAWLVATFILMMTLNLMFESTKFIV